MKRRFANAVSGEYFQKRVENDKFKGYVCKVKLNNINKPLIVYNGKNNVCIKDNDYVWYEAYPDNANYAITIMFDQNNNLIEWYFDVAKNIGLENGIPYEDDLFLDMIITPNGEKIIIDEDELIDALNKKVIEQNDVDLAYKTIKELEIKYVNDLEYLKQLTNYFCEIFCKEDKLEK